MDESVELLVDSKCELGEGPVWDAQNQLLYWINILEHDLHVYDPATGKDRNIPMGQIIGTVVPWKPGKVMVAVHHGFGSVDLETEELTIINDPEADDPRSRFNDGKCDPAGRFWAGTVSLDDDVKETSSLYRLDPDLSAHKMLNKITVSNGIVWTRDAKTMFYIDTPTWEIAAFDYDNETGEISNRRVAVSIPKEVGYPDGMAIDAEDKLWVGHWGGWHAVRWDPLTGKMIQTVKMPTYAVTACAFGGPDLEDLYITTATAGLNEVDLARQPHAGGLFRARPGVKGVKSPAFAG